MTAVPGDIPFRAGRQGEALPAAPPARAPRAEDGRAGVPPWLPPPPDCAGQVGASSGVNIYPGEDDDGWVVPPPVQLGDGTEVQLYKDGEALHAAAEAIADARRRICLEVYIFAEDDTGKAFAEMLCRKSRDGVRVFVVYDSVGSRGFFGREPEMFKEMRRNGVALQEFHPMRPWECRGSWRPANRDHRKLLLVDNDVAWMGGLNIGREYGGSWVSRTNATDVVGGIAGAALGAAANAARRAVGSRGRAIGSSARARSRARRRRAGPGPRKGEPGAGIHAPGDVSEFPSRAPTGPAACDFWRDNAIGVRGPGAAPFLQAFKSTWRYVTRGGPVRRAQFHHNMHDGELGLLASVPTRSSPLRPALHRFMQSARQSLLMTMAYFVPDDELVEELCAAARRGARVRLMLPGVSDVPAVRLAGRAFYGRLLDHGVEIYERQGVILHAKTMVADAFTTVIGSTNLDYRSIEYNLELSAIVRNAEFGRQMHDLFEHDVRFADRITPEEWGRIPYWDRVVQWTVSRARYLL